jgi:hypothetical protein
MRVMTMRERIATALLNTTGLAGIKHPQVIDNAVEDALGEVFAHVRGDTILPCRIVDDPAAEHIRALRKRIGCLILLLIGGIIAHERIEELAKKGDER